MGTKQNFGSSFNRRSFLQRSAVVGVGALGLDLLAACGPSASSTSSVVTASAAFLKSA